ncbi:hypothetical protein P9112_006360 [Eukaryota sp. TZLM1-RC]
MFGSSISPRSDPANILGNLSKFDSNIPLLDDIKMKNTRLQEKMEEAERHQSLNTPISVDNTNSRSIVFNIGDYVLRKTKQNNKLHGSWNGPFLVIDQPSNSTLLLKNLITGIELKAAKKDCKIYNAENPQDIEFLKAVAAGDAEKHVIEKILSEYHSDSGSCCTVQWFGGETTEEPLIGLNIQKLISYLIRITRKLENVPLVDAKVPPMSLRPLRGLDVVIELGSGANS